MADEPIGSVSVQIVADYSKMSEGFRAAQSEAAKAGSSVASSFSSAVGPTNSLTEASLRLKTAQSALSSEGAKMLAQVQASAPGYASAQAALAALNAEVVAANAALAEAKAAEKEMAEAEKAAARAAEQVAAAKQAETAAIQAAADAARVNATVEELLGSATRASALAFDQQAAAALRAASAIASGSTAGSVAATAAGQRTATVRATGTSTAAPYTDSVAAGAAISTLATQAQQLSAAMAANAAITLSAAEAQRLLATSTEGATLTLNAESSGTASSTAALGANANAALQAGTAQRQLIPAGQAMAAAQQQLATQATASTGAIMANANATLRAADADNQLVPAQNNAIASGFRLFLVIGALKKLFSEFDEVRKSEMELLHLSEATGISAQTFAQFQGAISRAGGDSDNFAKAMVFLSRSIEQGERGVKTMSDELHRLGVTSRDPIEAFYQIADTLHNTRDKSEALAAASRVLGRGEQELIGVLGEGSAVLRENFTRSEELARARVAAISSAAQLTAVEHELHAALTELGVRGLPLVTIGVRILGTAFDALSFIVKATVDTAVSGFLAVVSAAQSAAAVLADIQFGNFSRAAVDSKTAIADIQNRYRSYTEQIKADNKESHDFVERLWSDKGPQQTPGAGKAFPAPAVKFDKAPETELRHQYQEEFADLKADHELTISEELAFWTERYSIVAAKGRSFADLAREIHRTIGTLNQQQFKLEGRQFNRADDESFKEIEQQIKEAQEAAFESGGHPAKVKLDRLVELTSSDSGISADTYKKLFAQIPDAEKAADKEATANLKRSLDEQDKRWEESGIRTAKEMRQRAETTRNALEDLRPFFVGIDALIDAETAKIIAANKRIEAEKLKVADLVARGQESGGQAEVTSRRIALESAYGLQSVHTYQQQIEYQQQLDELEAESLRLKLGLADAEYRAAAASRDAVRIQEAMNAQAAAQAAMDLQAEASAARIARLKHDTSFGGMIDRGMAQAAESAVGRLAAGLGQIATTTKNWGQEFRNILKDVERQMVEVIAKAALLKGLSALAGAVGIGRSGSAGGGSGGGGVLGTTVGAAGGAAATIGRGVTGTAQAAAQTANTAALTADTAALTASTAGTVALTAAVVTESAAQAVTDAAMTGLVLALTANTAALVADTVALYANAATNFLGGFAEGGRPPVGVPSLVGEKGMELFVPDQAGTIYNADETQKMLAGMNPPSLKAPSPPSGSTASAYQGVPGGPGSQQQGPSTSTNNHTIGDTVHNYNIYGARDPRETMRQIADFQKRQTGKYSPANS